MTNEPRGLNRHVANTQLEAVSDTVRYLRHPVDPLGRGPYNARIPRIKTKMTNNNNNNNKDAKNAQQHPIRRFDTFGENAIETIYDEFRFLDDPDAPSPSSSGQPIISDSKKRKNRTSAALIAYTFLPIIQLICSVSLFILAILRCSEFYRNRKNTTLVDFDKPEGLDLIKPEGLRLVRFKSGCSVFLPAFFQALAALCGFWPFARGKKRCLQVLHILFATLSIICWFGAVEAISLEINLNFVQLQFLSSQSQYVLFVALLGLGYFEALFLPTVTLVIACRKLVVDRRHEKSLFSTSLAIGTALLTATVLCFSAFSTSKSLTVLTNPPNGTNQSIFYGFGLRELIISIYVLVCSILFFFSSVHRDTGLSVASTVLQFTSIISLSSYLFNASRIIAIIRNIAVLSSTERNAPIAYPSIILLYSFIACLLLLLCLQMAVTLFSMRRMERISVLPASEPQERTTF